MSNLMADTITATLNEEVQSCSSSEVEDRLCKRGRTVVSYLMEDTNGPNSVR